jgi:hypothetical protein
MKRIHMLQIKAQCIFHASQEEMSIIEITDKTFRAKGSHSEIYVDYQFLYDQLQNGWNIEETLQNETCYVEEETA